jgi:drug/metabolite transporter (DMT)-like permease
LQIFAVSSAGVVFKKLESDVQPITAAAWRLQATSIVMLPMFIAQWRYAPVAVRQQWWKAWPLMSMSGLALAVHFSTWVFGLARTSLPHALLFVTSTPIIIAAGSVVMGFPITRGEIASAVLGFLGMVLCEFATSSAEVRSHAFIVLVIHT